MPFIHRPTLLTSLLLTLLCTCGRAQNFVTPVNGITAPSPPVPTSPDQSPPRDADITNVRFVQREIDVREKMNLPFANPERPLVRILLDANDKDELPFFSPVDDRFSTPMNQEERREIEGAIDTIPYIPPGTCDIAYELEARQLDPTTIVRYRLREAHYFNRNTGRQEVRILGISPIFREYDENGDVLFDRPLFWVKYSDVRPVLSREPVAPGNTPGNRSWADVFDSRMFGSTVVH